MDNDEDESGQEEAVRRRIADTYGCGVHAGKLGDPGNTASFTIHMTKNELFHTPVVSL